MLDILFHALVRYAAPVLVFTSEEVWGTRFPEAGSVHLLEWPHVDAGWVDLGLSMKWANVCEVRSSVLDAIEPMRREKLVGSSLEAVVKLRLTSADLVEAANTVDLAEVCIAGEVTVTGFADDSIEDTRQIMSVTKTTHHKCGRCWRHLPEVSEDGALCGRCEDVVNG